jgi:putative cardiolipin synthase
MDILTDLLARDVAVAILTNSMMSSPELFVQAGYSRHRRTLLDAGADLYELRSQLGSGRGSGQSARISSFGNYSLHAKLFIFDRERVFVGSMNYDQRSKHLNTEIGVLIDSPELARIAATRFERMTLPENAYTLSLRGTVSGRHTAIVWDTVEDGQARQYTLEPARSGWQRLKSRLLMQVPDTGEL